MNTPRDQIVVNAVYSALGRLRAEYDVQLEKYWGGDDAAAIRLIKLKDDLAKVRDGYIALAKSTVASSENSD